VGSNSGGSGKRDSEVLAYLTDERVPAGERGGVILGLVAHAAAYLLLAAAQAAWCAVTAIRVWRRREAGWPVAVRTGVHRPTLAGLAAVTVGYEILRRLGVAGLSRRARDHAVRQARGS
jgi:hypothetical protein